MTERHLAERVAYKLVHHACRLQAGDFALLSGRRDQLDLLLRLEFQALAAGAQASIIIDDEERRQRLLCELSPAYAAKERLSRLPAAHAATHVFNLDAIPPDLRGLPQQPLQAWKEANRTLDAAFSPHCARIDVALPSRRQAQRLRQAFHPYEDAIWQALDSDYALMERRGQHLQAALAGPVTLRLSDPRGAELTLRLAEATPRRCNDGILRAPHQPEADERARLLLPAGEFSVAVVEGSAEGEIIIDAAWVQGQPLRHLRLHFGQGRVVGMEGAGTAQATAALATDDAAALLGSLSIGFNPTVRALRPFPLGPEGTLLAHRRSGAVFLTLGDNRALGGTNASALAWTLGVAHAMLEVDGQMLLRNGEFPEE
jgi:leucyl aminopeptidase (aminopeptidase T)